MLGKQIVYDSQIIVPQTIPWKSNVKILPWIAKILKDQRMVSIQLDKLREIRTGNTIYTVHAIK